MALVLNDRVKETSTSTGTGTINLGGAVDGFETFVAGIGNNNTTYYAIVHKTLNEFEIGIGTITDSSPDTITGRSNSNVLSSSNSDNVVNFSAGDKEVFCTQPAPKAVFKNENNDVVLADNQKSIFGDGEDLKIYSDGGGAVFETQDNTLDSFRFHKVNNGSRGCWVYFEHQTDTPSSVDFVAGFVFNHKDTTNNTEVPVAMWQMNNLATTFQQSVGGTLATFLELSGQNDRVTISKPVKADDGISIDNITIDGTEIDLSSGDLTIDVAGNISLDADDGGHVRFKDGGAEYFSIYEDASNNPIIQASIADTNILFKGTDGSSVITALDLDIANAGAATFNSSVTATTTVNVGTGGGFYLKQDSSKSTIRSEAQPIVLQTFASSAWQDRVTVLNNGNVGIGTTTPARKFDVEGSTNDDWISRIYNTNTNGAGLLVRTDATSSNDKIALGVYADSAYKMVVKSTGYVGVGTTTPAYALDINGGSFTKSSIRLTRTDSGQDNDPGLYFVNNAGANNDWGMGGIWFSNSTDGNAYGIIRCRTDDNTGTSGKLEFITGQSAVGNSTDPRMLIESNGEIGINTTSPTNYLHVHGGSEAPITISGASTRTGIFLQQPGTSTVRGSVLTLADTTFRLGTASHYHVEMQADGKTCINTTGNNFGVGTDAPEYPTHIQGSNVSSGGGSATVCIIDTGTAYNSTNPGGGITFRGKYNSSGSTTNFATIQGVKANTTDGDYASDLIFTTRANGGNLTEAMRIDNANRVILNNGSPIKWGGSGSLGYIYSASNSDTVIGSYDDLYLNSNWVRCFNGSNGSNGATEYARFSVSGNWITGPLGVNGVSSNYGSSGQVLTSNGNASPSWQTPSSGGYSANFTGYANAFSVGTSSTGGQGELRATANIIAYYSDERLKDFHGKIENAVDKVKQLNGYYFSENDKAKEYGYENQDKKQVGVSAQEVEKVLPEIVSQAPFDIAEDGTSKSGEDYKTVDYEKLVPLLIEAIKEQQIQIDCLKEQLNGNN